MWLLQAIIATVESHTCQKQPLNVLPTRRWRSNPEVGYIKGEEQHLQVAMATTSARLANIQCQQRERDMEQRSNASQHSMTEHAR